MLKEQHVPDPHKNAGRPHDTEKVNKERACKNTHIHHGFILAGHLRSRWGLSKLHTVSGQRSAVSDAAACVGGTKDRVEAH